MSSHSMNLSMRRNLGTGVMWLARCTFGSVRGNSESPEASVFSLWERFTGRTSRVEEEEEEEPPSENDSYRGASRGGSARAPGRMKARWHLAHPALRAHRPSILRRFDS